MKLDWIFTDLENAAEYRQFATGVALRVCAIVVSFVSVIITSRGLGVEGRGLLFTSTSAAQIAAQLLAFGMPSASLLVVARQPALASLGVKRALAAAAGAGGVAFLITGLLFRMNPPAWVSPDVIELSPIVSAMVSTLILFWWSTALTQALGAVDSIPRIELIYRVISVGWAWVALFLLRLRFPAFLWSTVAVDAMCGTMWLLYARRLAPMPAAPVSWPRGWMRLSLKAHLPLLLQSGMRRTDALLLTGFSGVRATGLYSVAVQVMDVCQIAPGFLGQKAMFAFSAGHGDSAPARRMRKVIPAMVIAVMVFAGLTARFWATRLIGRDFADVGLIILVLAIGGGALAWETVAVQEVNAKGYPLRLTFVWLACLCAALALMLVLIPSFGAIGAASAVSASFLMLAAMIYRLRKRTRKEASDAEPEVKRP